MGTAGKLLDRFCGEARLWGERTRAGEHDADDRMSPLWDELIKLDAGAEVAALLDHPAVAVRYCAAARLHRGDWRRARAVMEPIAAEPPPLGTFARRLLDRWARSDVEWDEIDLAFTGTVVSTASLIWTARPVLVTHVDPRFAVTVDVDRPPVTGPFAAGEVTFAVHSLAHCFSATADEITGARMRFHAGARVRDDVWRISFLRGSLAT